MASTPFAIDVLTGPSSKRETKDLEAGFARRSMMLIRRLLGEDRLIELLRGETVDSTEWWKKEFIQWFIPAQGGMLPEPEKLAAHPEHWVVRPSKGSKSMTVLETLGERPTLFTLAFDVQAADFVQDEPNFTTKMTGRGYLEDGSQIMELYHQFKDHADGQGFDVDLAIYFPVGVGEDVVECHRQHLLVEFSNWSKQAFEAKRAR
ncbi:hypothetical protein LTR66_016918 [Elasticomyces elasticus]|nr:hypothetical protein LTR66_016918 [Elasticomyces elasticus]